MFFLFSMLRCFQQNRGMRLTDLGVVLVLGLTSVFVRAAEQATPRPKLVVAISIDQFRHDYLTRFQKRFLSPRQRGFRYLMESNAAFLRADHFILQNMTGPGHANLLTGAYPYRHGISLNNWFDRSKHKEQYCVEDAEGATLVGVNGEIKGKGASPRFLKASTVGDELKLAYKESKVVGLALKDRAAILMTGHLADQVVWFDDKMCEWVTSRYYLKKDQKFPTWADRKKLTSGCDKAKLATLWGVDETLSLALSAVKSEKLGKDEIPDLLVVSISSHDYLGHKHGPQSPEMEALTLGEDKSLNRFIQGLEKELGSLKDVVFVLSADHGIAPSPSAVDSSRLRAGVVTEKELREVVDNALVRVWGGAESKDAVLYLEELEVSLSDAMIKKIETHPDKKREFIKTLESSPWIEKAIWRDDVLFDRKVPPGELGQIVDKTISLQNSEIILLLKPYLYQGVEGSVNHMTLHSYDRMVPLVIKGDRLKFSPLPSPDVKVADLAPTLSHLLGIIPPSASEGRVIPVQFR